MAMRLEWLMASLLFSCGERQRDEVAAPVWAEADTKTTALPPLSVVPEAVAASLTLDPNGSTPLAGLLTVETSVPTTATVSVQGRDSWLAHFSDYDTRHALPVLGLEPDQSYEISVRLTSGDGQRVFESEPLPLRTAPLPEDFPETRALTSQPARMEPGDTLVSARLSGDYHFIVNSQGTVIWYYAPAGAAWDIRQLPDGQLLMQDVDSIIVMDLLGNVSMHLEAAAIDRGYHHEVFPSSTGTLWTMGNRVATVAGFPTNYDDLSQLGTVDVTDDTLIELHPTGTVLQRIPLLDVLDPRRIAYDSLNDHVELGTPNDWAHANAIIEVDDGENVIVSCRHQDAVFKMRRDGSELLWILSNHQNWSEPFRKYLLDPIGQDMRWPYHQHAPQVTPGGTLLLFDNANHQASPSDGKPLVDHTEAISRVVEYRIDEAAMTVEQTWQYVPEQGHFSPVVGDADLQPTTNTVLATYGALLHIDGTSSAEMGRGRMQARILEIDPAANSELVFELEVYSSDPDSLGYLAYRADRIQPLR